MCGVMYMCLCCVHECSVFVPSACAVCMTVLSCIRLPKLPSPKASFPPAQGRQLLDRPGRRLVSLFTPLHNFGKLTELYGVGC